MTRRKTAIVIREDLNIISIIPQIGLRVIGVHGITINIRYKNAQHKTLKRMQRHDFKLFLHSFL